MTRREEYLKQLLGFFELDDGQVDCERGHAISPLDKTWSDWQKRTGELPPDFDAMPSIPFLPDPLVMDEGGRNVPITTVAQWKEKRAWMREQFEHWVTGTCPPAPGRLEVTIIGEERRGPITDRTVELRFGDDPRARLAVRLLIPPGDGPFPVFLTQWNHLSWALMAVRRGYVGCLYAGADAKDDAREWMYLWYPQHDPALLTRRAWGAHRAVDYLCTLPVVDQAKIGIAGHSRNGKQSLIAAAFDERIAACIPSSGGTGGEIPYRYAREKYKVETIKVITARTASWFHPRLRFFVGREHKLPVDQNCLMALIAPRHLMLCSAYTEELGNPWGIEQAFLSVKKVYEFLGAEGNLGLRLRLGGHGTLPHIGEVYLDFFDRAFGRGEVPVPRTLLWGYSFSDWLSRSGESVDVLSHPEGGISDLLVDGDGKPIASTIGWEAKKPEVVKRIKWALGEEPPGAAAMAPGTGAGRRREPGYMQQIIAPPAPTEVMGRADIQGPEAAHPAYTYHLYYPVDDQGQVKGGELPTLIYLHEYGFSSGFTPTWPGTDLFSIEEVVRQGWAVLAFDMIGMGTRIREGTHFYHRHPGWSKLGRMTADVAAAVTELHQVDFVDAERICLAGYALGGTVGLFAGALDERIAAVAACCAFTPLRLATEDKGLEGIGTYSHLHGLLPRLGFFAGAEARAPFDFHEVIACIAPRPLLLTAPQLDQDAHFPDVQACGEEASKVYRLFGRQQALRVSSPVYYNQFTRERQVELLEWLSDLGTPDR
jgi:cephalosporin-C deacetylase-like acetyl esterase